jgi:hypothetical protein
MASGEAGDGTRRPRFAGIIRRIAGGAGGSPASWPVFEFIAGVAERGK